MNDDYQPLVLINPSEKSKEKMREKCFNFAFPWGGGDEEDYLHFMYLVTPDEESSMMIQHQFNDVCCHQFYCRGRIDPLTLDPEILQEFLFEMQEFSPNLDKINQILGKTTIGSNVVNITGQGLIELISGQYILTEGND